MSYWISLSISRFLSQAIAFNQPGIFFRRVLLYLSTTVSSTPSIESLSRKVSKHSLDSQRRKDFEVIVMWLLDKRWAPWRPRQRVLRRWRSELSTADFCRIIMIWFWNSISHFIVKLWQFSTQGNDLAINFGNLFGRFGNCLAIKILAIIIVTIFFSIWARLGNADLDRCEDAIRLRRLPAALRNWLAK